jgi:hypothetical protein
MHELALVARWSLRAKLFEPPTAATQRIHPSRRVESSTNLGIQTQMLLAHNVAMKSRLTV